MPAEQLDHLHDQDQPGNLRETSWNRSVLVDLN